MLGRIFTDIFVPIFLLVLPFTLKPLNFGFDVATILTILSLIFAILAGFFIAAATSNYLRLQTLISEANASLISLFSLARLIQSSAAKKVGAAIDRYMIAVLDYDLLHYVPKTEKEFGEILDVIHKLKPTGEKAMAGLAYVYEQEYSLIRARQEKMLAAQTIVGPRHWFILVTFSILIAVLALALRDGTVVSAVITAVLLYSTYQVLKLLYEIDSNEFLAKKVAYKNPQEVFIAIGHLPYYPAYAIERGYVREPKTDYRLGIYKNYPKSMEKVIKTVHSKK
jgi:ABC-type multidrug transport system fused ATPase/permease subunit